MVWSGLKAMAGLPDTERSRRAGTRNLRATCVGRSGREFFFKGDSSVKRFPLAVLTLLTFAILGGVARAGEADLAIPDLHEGTFHRFGYTITAWNLLFWGIGGNRGQPPFFLTRTR